MADLQTTRAAKAVVDAGDRGFFRLVSLSPAGVTAPGYSADENDDVAFVFEPLRRNVLFIVNESDHRDRWRGIHDAEGALIVQRDISACNRRSECVACFSHAFNGF